MTCCSRIFLLWICLSASGSLVQAQALAQNNELSTESNSETNTPKTYQQLQQETARLKEADEVRNTILRNLIRRIETLEKAAANAQAPTDSDAQHGASSRDESVEKATLSPQDQERMRKESEENYQMIENAFEQRLGRQGGMLLGPYQLTYEPSISYAHSSYDTIVVDGFTVYPVLVIGDIVSEKIRRDVILNNHSLRLGLPKDFQLDLMIPLGYERARSFRDDGTYENHNTEGLGDISLALSHQVISQSNFWPDTVVGLSWKSKSGSDPYKQASNVPTLGSGFETWGLSMTSITAADPMVLFGGLSTSYTPALSKNIGRIKPGQGFGLNLGMALSLNLDTSLSFGFGFNHTLETEINAQSIHGSDLSSGTFSIGLSKAKSDFYAMDVDLTIGLTRDAPDFQIGVALPFDFSLAGSENPPSEAE